VTTAPDYPPGTLGAEMQRLRAEAEALGLTELVDRIDAAWERLDRTRDAILRDAGVL